MPLKPSLSDLAAWSIDRSKKFEPPQRKPFEKITEALDLLNGLAEITTESLKQIQPKKSAAPLVTASAPVPAPVAATPSAAPGKLIQTKPMFSTSRPEYKGALQDPKLVEALLRITQNRKAQGKPKPKASTMPTEAQDNGFRLIQPEQIDAGLKPQPVRATFSANRTPVMRTHKRK